MSCNRDRKDHADNTCTDCGNCEWHCSCEPQIIVHRDVPGDHDIHTMNCWCRPVSMTADEWRRHMDRRDTDTPVGKDS